VHGELTDEWKTRGVQEGREYSILTAEIARRNQPGCDRNHRGKNMSEQLVIPLAA